jgi:hypothetical protein
MDWGGGFGIYTYMSRYIYIYIYIYPFSLKENGERLTNKDQLRGKKHVMPSIHLFVSFIFFKLGFN